MRSRVICFLVSLCLVFVGSAPVSALSRADLKFYAQNNILFIDDSEDKFLESCLSGELVDLGENSKTALNFLINKGYSKSSAAAIVGNLIAESNVIPNILEGGKYVNDPSWKVTNWEKFGKRGFGIAQWTTSGRQTNLQNFADSQGLPVSSMEAQLAFLFQELNGGSYRGATVESMNGKSLEEATFYIYRYFETPLSSFCHTNDKNGCYNNFAPSSFSDLSPTETKSAYQAFSNRLKYARSALADTESLSSGEASSTSGGTSSLTCNGISANAEGAEKIVSVAKAMSWPNERGYCDSALGQVAWRSRASGGTQACSATLNATAKLAQQAVGGLSLRDCGKFVGAVMIYGEIDPDYPRAGTRNQLAYLNSSKKWTKVSTDNEAFPLSDLRPGDVLVYSSGTGDAAGGHTMIWIGEQSVTGAACDGGSCKVNIASASLDTWTPSLNYMYRTTTTYKGVNYNYSVFRLAKYPEANL
ncbi:hypothetical protein IJ380_02220 [Candidatus Saccharibacteria bacterium]|nr:hypothetical protein [Candidatus Saccharibacteria bacterium]